MNPIKAESLPRTDYDDMYEDVAAYLSDPANHPDMARGIVNIEYGDAKVYATAWVNLKQRSPGFEAGAIELEMVTAMIERYREDFDRFSAHPVRSLLGDLDALMNIAVGVEGVFKAFEHDPRPEYRELISGYLGLFKPAAKRPLIPCYYHVQPYGPVTVIAGGAWFYLSYPLTFGMDDPHGTKYMRIGLDIIDRLDRRLYDPVGRKYNYSLRPGYTFTYAYNNTVMVQALARAYLLTGDERYYRRGMEIVQTMEQDLYYPKYNGYLAAEGNERYRRQYDKIGPHYNKEYMALSAHNYIAYACLTLYEAGGFRHDRLLDPARRALAFEKEWLWKGKGRIEHDIVHGKLALSEDYCGGCNFQTLYNVLLLKHAMMKQPALGLNRG